MYIYEGVSNLTKEEGEHEKAFYEALLPLMDRHESCKLFFKKKYDDIIHVCKSVHDDGVKENDLIKAGYTQARAWANKYAVVSHGSSEVVVVKNAALDTDHLTRPSYYERVFADLKEIHAVDHPKGNSFFKRVKKKYDNIPRNVCKLFTDTCRRCTETAVRKKPTAGVKNIITEGFGVRGQVDLIDFQSMPDGEFKFLLNYVDHGIKKLTSIPIVAKRASTVALALLTIFTEQGPPCILQADNGREFFGSARSSSDRRVELDDEFIDNVIQEIKNLWPQVKLVRGSSRHSESNGGVERANQTVEKKLGAWMKDNNSKRWSIGCKIIQWQINTTEHLGIKAVPYELTYGQLPRVGISNLPIDSAVLDALATEADLNKFIDISAIENATTCPPPATTAPVAAGATAAAAAASSSSSSASEQLHEHEEESDDIPITDPRNPEYGLKPAADIVLSPNAADIGEDDADESATNTAVNAFDPIGEVAVDELATNTASTTATTTAQSAINTAVNAVYPIGEYAVDDSATNTARPTAAATVQAAVAPSGEDTADEDTVDWLELVHERNGKGITKVELGDAALRNIFPCICCDHDDDVQDPSTVWTRVILQRVTKDEWDVYDETWTELIRSIKWGLDENGRRLKGKGINETLHNLWGIWYKNPTSHDIALAEKDARQREEQRQHEDDSIRQTPRRRRRREEATQNQRKQATKMYKRAKSADGGEFEVGDVVQVPLADVDRTKVDSSHITAVIVEVGKNDLYRVACKYGQLKSMYAYHRLKRVTGVSNNPNIHGLDDVLVSWRGLARITEREAARHMSSVGGQGVFKCGCSGACDTKRCICKKEGVFCNSRCHKGNHCNCQNFDKSSLL